MSEGTNPDQHLCANKVLLEHSLLHLLHFVYGCFPCCSTDLSCSKDWPMESKIFTIWPPSERHLLSLVVVKRQSLIDNRQIERMADGKLLLWKIHINENAYKDIQI